MAQKAELTPNNIGLWQNALAVLAKRWPNTPHDSWNARSRAIAWYYDKGGRFVNTRPVAQFSNTEATQIVKNTLASRGIQLTANLMQHSLSYQWREYLGHNPVTIKPPNDATPIEAREIRPNGFFGIKAEVGGYSILFPDANNTRFNIPHLAGYALISLSRELSRRETKFKG